MASRRDATRRRPAKARPRRAKATPAPGTKAALARLVRTLEQRLARATAALAALRVAHGKKMAAVRRAADRRLAVMLRELAALRHHEARAQALERVLQQEREAAAAADRRNDGQAPGTAG